MTHPVSRCLIDGRWVNAASQRVFAVHNPATGELLASVPDLSAEEIEYAISTASAAFKYWRSVSAQERSLILQKIASLLRQNAETCASIITAEQGKPLKEARGEVQYAADYFDWFAGEAVRIYGDIIPANSAQKRILVLKQPIGVVAAITPWNFPLAMLARKVAAALAAGCTVIAKPAPETPLSAFFLGKICCEAQLPPGVLNIITGDAQRIGEHLMRSHAVKKVTFTGSTEIGQLLLRQSADTVKKLTLELGGNAPFIVCDDADLSKAVEGATHGKYRNAGQTCVCVNRFLVHESVAREFTELLATQTRGLIVGDGASEGTDIGPLISRDALAKVKRLVAFAIKEGATIACGELKENEETLFMSPMILSGVKPNMSIWEEEIFGPISSITTFKTDDEAIALANNTSYGLAAYLYSNDLSRALRISEQLEFGMVGINDTAISAVQAPFGGIKQSGFGREGSKYGLDEYLVLKYLSVAM